MISRLSASQAATGDRLGGWYRLIGAPVALVAGAGIRLWFYFLNDSFWRDETKLLLNIAHKSFLELLSPLDPKQVAPVPLLWLYRVVYLWGGGGELSMRAFSLITSIPCLPSSTKSTERR